MDIEPQFDGLGGLRDGVLWMRKKHGRAQGLRISWYALSPESAYVATSQKCPEVQRGEDLLEYLSGESAIVWLSLGP
jgi:hypothetical protein